MGLVGVWTGFLDGVDFVHNREGYNKLHPWRSNDDSSDSWHSGQMMGSNKDYAMTWDNHSDSWHTCLTMGSNKSQSDPHNLAHTTNYDADDEDYKQ